jgi:hypothetical protein
LLLLPLWANELRVAAESAAMTDEEKDDRRLVPKRPEEVPPAPQIPTVGESNGSSGSESPHDTVRRLMREAEERKKAEKRAQS